MILVFVFIHISGFTISFCNIISTMRWFACFPPAASLDSDGSSKTKNNKVEGAEPESKPGDDCLPAAWRGQGEGGGNPPRLSPGGVERGRGEGLHSQLNGHTVKSMATR